MVGSFYELYDIQNTETGETECNVREIVDILGIQLSTKKGDFAPNQDGLFAGFPDYAMHKWAGRLTSANYTVVIVDQIKDMRGKVKERKVSRILSPSTHIENTVATETPYVITIYLQSQGDRNSGNSGNSGNSQTVPHFGVAILDLTTGTTRTYAGITQGRPDLWTADDLNQLLSVFQPKEILIYCKHVFANSPIQSLEQHFRRIFSIAHSIIVHIRPVDTLGAFAKDLVRTEYFQKIYSIKSLLPPKTYLGLRSDTEEIALLYLLQFVEEHYPSMLQSFHRNEPWIPQMRLICGNHALTQLQMTSSTNTNGAESVIGLFDKSITSMGKRAIRERLLQPYSDATEISKRLEEVKEYTLWPEAQIKALERQLRMMYDLPRLHRKLLCGLITPQEIAGLFQTYTAIHNIMLHITKGTLLQQPYTEEDWSTYITVFRHHFTQEKVASADITVFNVETYPEIGEKEQEIQAILQRFQELRRKIAKEGGVNEEAVRLEEREKEPYGLKASTVTLQQLKKKVDWIKVTELKSGGWIDCQTLQQLNTQLQKTRDVLDHLVRKHMLDASLAISQAGQYIWTLMEQWVNHVDCTQCIGYTSKERGFTCPIIEPATNGSSFDIKKIRHPLVEAASSRVTYVKHDVALNDETKGWLVYGMNASGKSTLMKATGICILLAQAGSFVPAKEMTLRPFQAIYTRILNQDNLFAGLSSFAVEMSELRDILRNANPYSLVLGDELCAGTESTSALALVSSGIQWLTARDAKFIFATHLHDLPQLIDNQSTVKVWHLHVDYDPVTKKLVYDRQLREGNGSTLYGLEVARAMDLPSDFIEQAMQNRHRILGSTTQNDAKASAWNKEIVRKECELCKKPNTLEVHHLVPRASATKSILEDGSVMNDKRNLMVICQTCHDEIHANKVEIKALQITSDGPEREIVRSPIQSPLRSPIQSPIQSPGSQATSSVTSVTSVTVNPKKGKWDEGELEVITEMLRKYPLISLKIMKGNLSTLHSIEISESMLGKMRKMLRDM